MLHTTPNPSIVFKFVHLSDFEYMISGKIYTGANIENSSYPATVCAERVAIFKAISDGEYEFEKIAISGSGNDFCYPCGICRQVMSEFCKENFLIILENGEKIKELKLGELLPHSFKL